MDTDIDRKVEQEFEEESNTKPVTNIFKNIWARVYLNVYSGDFTADNELTLEAALIEFFLPTTKRKQSWRHWLGAGSSELSIPKAAFIILLDIVFFFPRLALNIAKLFTEVLPDTIAQLFLLANRKAKEGYDETSGLPAFGYGLGIAVTGLFGGLFKLIYLIGCCITSPIATSIRARNFNYEHDMLPKWLSTALSDLSGFLSHVSVPTISFGCYIGIAVLLASFIPGLGFLTIPVGTALLGYVFAYIVIDHLLSCFNRNPNGDDLFELQLSNGGPDQFRYLDRDASQQLGKKYGEEAISEKVAQRKVQREGRRTISTMNPNMDPEQLKMQETFEEKAEEIAQDRSKEYEEVEAEIERTLTYKYKPLFPASDKVVVLMDDPKKPHRDPLITYDN